MILFTIVASVGGSLTFPSYSIQIADAAFARSEVLSMVVQSTIEVN